MEPGGSGGRAAFQGERKGGGKIWRLDKIGVLEGHPRPEWPNQMRSETAGAGPRAPWGHAKDFWISL